MPYVDPGDVVTGTTITSTWGDNVRNALQYLANPPSCRVYNSAAISIANNSGVIPTFNSERWDTATMHSTSSATSRITATAAGLYLITFTGAFAAGSDYVYAYAGFRLNGSNDIAYSENYPEQGGNTVDVRVNVTTVYKLAVSDFVEVIVAQRNTAAVSRNLLAAGNYSPEFSATWIGLG